MKSLKKNILNRSASLSAVVVALGIGLAACGSGNASQSASDDSKKSGSQAKDLEIQAAELSNAPVSKPSLAEVAAATPQLSTLFSLVKLCDLGTALSDASASLTVFAPTNDAFAKILGDSTLPSECSSGLKSTLLYHVLPAAVRAGDLTEKQSAASLLGAKDELFITKNETGVTVNGTAKVVLADVEASNGVAHVIDTVLTTDAAGTVVDAAIKRYEFSSLVGAVVSAGLADTLATAENITVFAPTNAAFAELSAVPAGEALTKVLTHHVIGSRVLAADLQSGLQRVPTLNQDKLNICVSESGAKIWGSGQTKNDAGMIIATDIITKNGVIHAISKVLIPSNL